MLNHDRRGAGPPLVLIHGIGSRWQVWEPILDEVARHREVIALDLPGFGASPLDANGFIPNSGAPGPIRAASHRMRAPFGPIRA